MKIKYPRNHLHLKNILEHVIKKDACTYSHPASSVAKVVVGYSALCLGGDRGEGHFE